MFNKPYLSQSQRVTGRTQTCLTGDKANTQAPLQAVVTLLDPLQEGGAVAAAAVTVLEQLVVHARHLLGDKLKNLPPLPQAVEGLGKLTLNIASQ